LPAGDRAATVALNFESGAKLFRASGLGEFRQSLHQFIFGIE